MNILMISKELELLEQLQITLKKMPWNFQFVSDVKLAQILLTHNPEQFDSVMLDDALVESKFELQQFKLNLDPKKCFILFRSKQIERAWVDEREMQSEQISATDDARQLMAKLETLKTIMHQNKTGSNQELLTPILHVDELTQEVSVRGEKLEHLTPKEFDLLLILVKHPRQVLTREMLLQKVWHEDIYIDTRTVDTHIKMIRKKLPINLIKTVWGRGYKFED
ncbi:winged-helix domain-containing protein [Weissella coleopterorum]|uniref:Winged-helix domain-containing protein n=1 Tax=Weissella coleopterorum TaxID=2714949 RepID=A0A6G8B1N3_9LACO|nr:winged-helix domain-containing protein [Weissella coleopterorum]QIL51043.1 winged-helix domain-containing protein [Weissella coleopterorum]